MKHTTFLSLQRYYKSLLFIALTALLTPFFTACEDDDDGVNNTFVQRDRAEQQVADKDSIMAYLNSHYYNSGFLANTTNPKYEDIVISELEKDANGNYIPLTDTTNYTMLSVAISTHNTTYLDTEYEYYVLNINQGGGKQPAFTDQIRCRYEGEYIKIKTGEANEDTTVFFQSTSTPVNLQLQSNGVSGGAIRAWQLVMPQFKTAVSNSIDANGNLIFNNFGLGVMFVPSGLAYFSGSTSGIPAYSNLIFKFEVLQYEVEDHDNDGIPSFIEDTDNDTDVFDNDKDEDNIPNFIDADDDGDGILSVNEHQRLTQEVNITSGQSETPLDATTEFEYNRTTTTNANNEEILTIYYYKLIDANNNGSFDYLDAETAEDNNPDN